MALNSCPPSHAPPPGATPCSMMATCAALKPFKALTLCTTMALNSCPPSHAPPPGATPCSMMATCHTPCSIISWAPQRLLLT